MSKKMVVVIPAYNPCGKLIELITQLNNANFTEIICVNDGSRDDEIFTKINDRCTVITHEVNKGKGCALKTAFSYIVAAWKMGLPCMLQQAVMYIAGAVVNPVVNDLGEAATAGYTVCLEIYKVCTIARSSVSL